MSPLEVSDSLELDNITDRPWSIQACSAKSGNGVDQGLNWITDKLKKE